MKNELVIIGDIVRSKKERAKSWKEFSEKLRMINEEFKHSLKIPFTVYAGDSFGAVAKNLHVSTKIVLRLFELLLPLKSRLLISEGEITYGLREKSFTTLQGPAFWKSQELLKDMKKNKRFFNCIIEDPEKKEFLYIMINFLIHMKANWDELDKNIIARYEEGMIQEKIAGKLKVTQQYVSKRLAKSNLSLVREGEEYLMDRIKK